MKKIISLALTLMIGFSFCMPAFADASQSVRNTFSSVVEPRRAEVVEVVAGEYLCTDFGGDIYVKHTYQTFLIPPGKTLVCTSSAQLQWILNNYTVDGRVWKTVSYFTWTYEIV